VKKGKGKRGFAGLWKGKEGGLDLVLYYRAEQEKGWRERKSDKQLELG